MRKNWQTGNNRHSKEIQCYISSQTLSESAMNEMASIHTKNWIQDDAACISNMWLVCIHCLSIDMVRLVIHSISNIPTLKVWLNWK